MVVHIDNLENVRKDLVLTIQLNGDKLVLYVDQQRPPCGDFVNTNHVHVDLPEELSPGDIFLLRT